MSGNNNNIDIKWYKKSWFWFALICAFVTITTAVAFCSWHSTNASRQDYIFKVYNKNIENAHDLLKSARNELLDSLRSNPQILLADYDTLERLTKIAEKLIEEHTAASLLEVEANKIQNQYEALGVWASIITIVFLIFSFYNLFKSEELQNEGKLAVKDIKDLKKEAEKNKNEIGDFNNKANEKLKEIEILAQGKLSTLESSLNESSAKVNENNRIIGEFENRVNSFGERVDTEIDKLKNYSQEISKTKENEKNSQIEDLKSEIKDLKQQIEALTSEFINRDNSDPNENIQEAETLDEDDSIDSTDPSSKSDLKEQDDDRVGEY